MNALTQCLPAVRYVWPVVPVLASTTKSGTCWPRAGFAAMSCAPCPVAVLNAARSVYAVPAQTYSGAALAGSMRLYAVTLCAVDDASTDTPTPVSGLLQADGCAGALCA